MAPSESEGDSGTESYASADGSCYSNGEYDEESGYYRLLSHETRCGCLFFKRRSGTKQLVCYNPIGCRREGHSKDAERADEGYYRQTQTFKNPDKFNGVAKDFLTEDEYLAREERRKKLNSDLLTAIGLNLKDKKEGGKRESRNQRKLRRDSTREKQAKGAGETTGSTVGWTEDEICVYEPREKAAKINTKSKSAIDPGVEEEAQELIAQVKALEAANGQLAREAEAARAKCHRQSRQKPVKVETVSESESEGPPALASREDPSSSSESESSDDSEEPPPLACHNIKGGHHRRRKSKKKPLKEEMESDSDSYSEPRKRKSTKKTRRQKNRKRCTKKYYAVCRARKAPGYGVFKDKKRAQRMYESSKESMKKTCSSKSEAWRWIERYHRDFDSSSSESSSSEDSSSEDEEAIYQRRKVTKGEPDRPPIGLSSKDTSTKDKTKLHDISIRDNSTKDLQAKLCPPGFANAHTMTSVPL